MANKYKAEVAVAGFGDGYHLRLDWSSLAELETRHGDDWWLKICSGLERASILSIAEVCEVGLRDEQGQKTGKPATWPDDVSPLDTAQACLDALALAQRGKTWQQLIDEAERAISKAKKNPTLSG